MPPLAPFLLADGGVILRAMRWLGLFATLTLTLVACTATAPAPPRVSQAPRATPPLVEAPRSKAVAEPAPSGAGLEDARHVLNRFAFGPRPGEVERVAKMGPRRWLDEQLAGPEESPLLDAALVPHRSAFAPPKQLVEEWLGEDWEESARSERELRREARSQLKEHLERLATAELTRHILSRRQVEAVMTDFWANHFNVFAGKGLVRLFEGDYLERAIRPHALGRFSDLLLATARHPAMLLYLDNAESRKVSGRARSGRARRGLNENYARELLELHTLGVDGGYTQRDVQEVARILTGWSVVRPNEGGFDFVFRKFAHDRREKTVLGVLFPAGEGEAEGRRLLELLAGHPSTARHVSRRLCARFVADDPPASCVAAAERAFRATGGQIPAVLRAITEDESFWSPSVRRAKLKTPLELLASAARALDAVPDGNLALSEVLERLGEPLLRERVPTGYPETELEWASAGGMLERLKFVSQLGAGRVEGLRVPWDEQLPLGPGLNAALWRFGGALGVREGSRTMTLVRDEVAAVSDPEQRRAAAVALFLGSPEFQRQ